MKISFKWISEIIDENLDFKECAELLTDIGLEVEKSYDFSNTNTDLSQLLIGKVKECIKHPNADRLKLTTVDIGDSDDLKIICGAPNVDVDQTVVVAPVGSTLTSIKGDSLKIKKAKIRDIESHGMLCAEDEIGIGESHDGIIILDKEIKPGTKASKVFKSYSDKIFEIGLTPNRCDAISHFGVSRDLRAAISYRKDKQIDLISPSISNFHNTIISPNLNIDISDSKDCRRFCGLIINNIEIKDSPDFIKNRLNAIGINPINNIVDITNYVMHELGQPLHAYDRNKIKSNTIKIQKFSNPKKFITLDGEERDLTNDDLMICDDNTPMCIAGIYGGLNHSVTDDTTTIFLESAYFDPVTIRKSSKHHLLNTDSSYRFERGVDLDNTEFALKRAAALIIEHCNGEIISDLMDEYPCIEDYMQDPPLQYDYASDSIDFKNIDFDSDSLEDINSKTEIVEIEDIRDIDVEFETVTFNKSEIIDERIELDFRDIYVNDAEIVKSEDKNLNSDKVIHVLEEDIKDIEVVDPVQIIPYTMVGDSESVKVTDEINTNSENKKSVEDFNPFDNPIAKALAKRTEERKIKLKEFNYKFAKSRRVEDMEKEPAYKRAGIDLENDLSTEISMTKVEEDDNGNIELKSKNSFLHDNVD